MGEGALHEHQAEDGFDDTSSEEGVDEEEEGDEEEDEQGLDAEEADSRGELGEDTGMALSVGGSGGGSGGGGVVGEGGIKLEVRGDG